jgi:hypothetical protein
MNSKVKFLIIFFIFYLFRSLRLTRIKGNLTMFYILPKKTSALRLRVATRQWRIESPCATPFHGEENLWG